MDMLFNMQHKYLSHVSLQFTEVDAPDWLTGPCHCWFWKGYVLPLEVGKSVETDFNTITRIA